MEQSRGGRKRAEKSLNLTKAGLRIIPKASSRVVKTPFMPDGQRCCLQGLWEVWDKVGVVTSHHSNHVWPEESSLY